MELSIFLRKRKSKCLVQINFVHNWKDLKHLRKKYVINIIFLLLDLKFLKKNELSKILDVFSLPIVVKADGLAAGKGVYICNHKKDLKIAINEIFDGKFGLAKKVLVEEYLDGEEMSFFIISDGKTLKFLGAQDHKKLVREIKEKYWRHGIIFTFKIRK